MVAFLYHITEVNGVIAAWMICFTPFTSGAVPRESEVLVFPRGLARRSRRARGHMAAIQDIDDVRKSSC
jgi:hypothetical protein